jgi:hypothetical protein
MRTGLVGALIAVALGASGCSLFVAPNIATAPLKASLAAEALYAGPLTHQPRDLARLGSDCSGGKPEDCRFSDTKPQRGISLGTVTLLQPSKGGAALRAPWIEWTQIYRLWDRLFATEHSVKDYFWAAGESDTYTPLFQAFQNFTEVARAELGLDRGRLRAELIKQEREVLVRRVRALRTRWQAAVGADKSALEREIRDYLELLAATEQRAEERVRKLDTLAEEEAALYAAMADATRVLDGLQRNISNHLLAQDFVLTAEEAKALSDATTERFKRVRESIDAGRKAELEAQKKAQPPEWAERLEGILRRLRGTGGN